MRELMLQGLSTVLALHVILVDAELFEFCEREIFRVVCKEDEVIIINHGRYGRMRESRCISNNFGAMECFTDVRDLLDVLCSGRRRCEATVATLVPDKSQPCPDDFRSYLEVAYECVKVVRVDRQYCKTSAVIEVRQPTGYLSSLVTEETDCGSFDSPWWLAVSPGQRLKLYLIDFGSSLQAKDTGAGAAATVQKATNCHVLVVLKEAFAKAEASAAAGESETVCAKGLRERHIYTSRDNVVEARIVQRKQNPNPQFLIRFEAVGCPDIQPPKNGGLQKVKDEVIVWCNDSEYGISVRDQWRLKCVGNQWVGNPKNCTSAAIVSGSGFIGWPIFDKSHGVPILLVLAIALAVGITMAIIGSLYLRHQRLQRSELGRGSVSVRPHRPSSYGYAAEKRQQERDEASNAFRPMSDIDSYLSSENDYYKAWQVQRPPLAPSAAAGVTAVGAAGVPFASTATYPLTSYVLPVGAERNDFAVEQTEHFIDHVYESPKFHKKESV